MSAARRFGWLLAGCCWSGIAAAQGLCAIGDARFAPLGDQQADETASSQMREAYELLCEEDCGDLGLRRNDDVDYVMAYWDGEGTPQIRYNLQFASTAFGTLGGAATFGLFAHQLGHILDAGRRPGPISQRSREERADEYAGCALARADLPPNAMDALIAGIAEVEGPLPGVPTVAKRLARVRLGHARCARPSGA